MPAGQPVEVEVVVAGAAMVVVVGAKVVVGATVVVVIGAAMVLVVAVVVVETAADDKIHIKSEKLHVSLVFRFHI